MRVLWWWCSIRTAHITPPHKCGRRKLILIDLRRTSSHSIESPFAPLAAAPALATERRTQQRRHMQISHAHTAHTEPMERPPVYRFCCFRCCCARCGGISSNCVRWSTSTTRWRSNEVWSEWMRWIDDDDDDNYGRWWLFPHCRRLVFL